MLLKRLVIWKRNILLGLEKISVFRRNYDSLPRPNEKACTFAHGKVYFNEANFLCGLHFLVHPFIMELLRYLKIALGQLVPNAWHTNLGVYPLLG